MEDLITALQRKFKDEKRVTLVISDYASYSEYPHGCVSLSQRRIGGGVLDDCIAEIAYDIETLRSRYKETYSKYFYLLDRFENGILYYGKKVAP